MNKYLSTLAAMAGASVVSLGLSSAYYSRQMDKEAYRARIELDRARQESKAIRAPVVEQRSVAIGLICIIADVDGDGLPDMRFFTPDGKQIVPEDDLESFRRRSYHIETF